MPNMDEQIDEVEENLSHEDSDDKIAKKSLKFKQPAFKSFAPQIDQDIPEHEELNFMDGDRD